MSDIDHRHFDFCQGHVCDHDDYDIDILTGRASCNMCDYRWWASEREINRYNQSLFAEPDDKS